MFGLSAKKRLCLFLAAVMSIAMLAGCGKVSDGEDAPEEEPNVITVSEENAAEGAETTVSAIQGDAPAITEVVTNENGEAVTEADGSAVTEIVTAPADAQTQPTGTLSSDDIQDIITATVTQATTVVAANNIASSEKYGYQSLSDDEKKLYDVIVDTASTMNFKIRGTDNLSFEEWAKVYSMVYNQEPQLFWLNKKTKKGRLYFSESDPEKIKTMQAAIDKTVDKIMADANKKSTAFDKLKVFHDYLVLNSTFEKDDSDIYAWNASIYNAFVPASNGQGNIQCAGYAKAMLYLCEKAGIPCMVITGTNKDGATHAWNKVQVDGQWYNLDCTWDDPILAVPETDYLRYTYFLVPDSWINEITHCNVNQLVLTDSSVSFFTPPSATATAENYFIKSGLVYNDFDAADKALKAQIDAAVKNGTTVTQIMVGSKDLYTKITDTAKDYQNYAKGKSSSVKGIATGSCSEEMLLIEFDVKYN